MPENLLKFYLHFSAPMSRGEAYRRIHLLDADGNEVGRPFLELGEELWDRDMRRFTLLFDPGRIKRGLKPREEVGPCSKKASSYTLVVDRDWLDASGHPLAAEDCASRSTVLPPDDAPIELAAWKLEPPAGRHARSAGGALPRADWIIRCSSAWCAWSTQPTRTNCRATIDITDQETCWRFTPEHAWQAGDYRLVADTTLEDLAGNSIGRAFDVDVFEPVQKRITTEHRDDAVYGAARDI